MIVARIYTVPGPKNSLASGSIQIQDYDGKKDGWFPVESFNFGFIDSPTDGGDDDASAKKTAPTPPAGRGGSGGGSGSKRGKKKDKDFAELTLEKQVDVATCNLMFLAMVERKSKKGSGETKQRKIQADIHVLASVQLDKSATHFVYPMVIIHLEAVNILGWDLKASGDGRPSESVKLRYDRAALVYVSTPDGKKFQDHGPRGWDQTNNEEFPGKCPWPRSEWDWLVPISR